MAEPVAISKLMEELLGDNRDALNSRFRMRIKQGAQIDPERWMQHVQLRIAPIVDAIGTILPERCRVALNELYDVSLELFSFGHFGDGSSALHFYLTTLWEKCLPGLAPILAREPRQVAGSLSNGMLFVAQSKPASAETWLNHLTNAGPLADSSEQLLKIGKVASWVSGLAEYRAAAIEMAQSLPAKVMRRLLGFPVDQSDAVLKEFLRRMHSDPWTRPTADAANNSIEKVAECGSFRGFGGVLMAPPRVFANEGQLFVTDERDTWQLFADQFGSSLLRSSLNGKQVRARSAGDDPLIDASGNVKWSRGQAMFRELANATSQAFDGTTFAVTIPRSFHVFLLARPTIVSDS